MSQNAEWEEASKAIWDGLAAEIGGLNFGLFILKRWDDLGANHRMKIRQCVKDGLWEYGQRVRKDIAADLCSVLPDLKPILQPVKETNERQP